MTASVQTLSAVDLSIMAAIITRAEAVQANPTMSDLLHHYDEVLRGEGVSSGHDTFYYRTLLRLGQLEGGSWWERLSKLSQVRGH